MKKLIIILLSFLIISNFLIWNIGSRTVSTDDTTMITEKMPIDEAKKLVKDKTTPFFLKEKSDFYEYQENTEWFYEKSLIPMIYSKKYKGNTNYFISKAYN